MQSKLKLLIIGSSKGLYGGIEAYMIALAAAASEWPEFEVKLCFKLIKGAELKDDLKSLAIQSKVPVVYVKRGSKELLKIISWANVLHIQNVPPDIILLSKFLGKKLLATIHNRRMSEFNLHNLVWGISVKFVHRRWFNSNFVWNSWEPNYKSSKSECVPTVCRLPKNYCPIEERKGFVFVGRWILNKGIEEIIQAYAKNKFNPEEWPLTILGDGPIKPKILSLIKDLNLPNINMPGFVDDVIKEKYISSAKWLLAPANTKEDLGLTPIEGRSVGVPAIVTKDGGLPESGGPAALLAEPGNVEDLASCMLIASKMSLEEYKLRCDLSRSSLDDFLKPMSFYRTMYNN